VLVLLLAGAASVSAAKIEQARLAYQPAEVFQRIAEYLDPAGGERSNGRWVVRTDASKRAGLYFMLNLTQPLPPGAIAEVTYLHPHTGTELQTEVFQLATMPHGQRDLWLGLTGLSGSKKRALLAWKVRLLDAEGQLLDSVQSFLWSDSDLSVP
jgi:hypothetical protein